MMRSLFSGVAGLKTHQTKMDVIGNNIANVNTVGYKASAVTFNSLMYQTSSAASGASDRVGGTNAKQIGLGVKTASISTRMEGQGSAQNTGQATDLMMTGDNFFIVSDGSNTYFTRDGSFYIDGAGSLCMSSNGYRVQGWGTELDPDGALVIKQDTVKDLPIMTADNLTYPPESTSKAYFSGILDKNDSQLSTEGGKTMNLNFYDELGYSYTARISVHRTSKSESGNYYMKLDDVRDANGTSLKDIYGVDDISQIVNLVGSDTATGDATAPDGSTYPTYTSTQNISDPRNMAQGVTFEEVPGTGTPPGPSSYRYSYVNPTDATDTLTVTIAPSGTDPIAFPAEVDKTNMTVDSFNKLFGTNLTAAEYDDAGTVVKINADGSCTVNRNITVNGTALTYNPDNGDCTMAGESVTLQFRSTVVGTDTATSLRQFGGDDQTIAIDVSNTKCYNNGKTSTINATAGAMDTGAGSGRKVGKMSGFTIAKDGMIHATYDNGQTKLLGQIPTAAFANPGGLSQAGDNLYQETLNSGAFDGIGVDVTASGDGYISSGVLEMSNVDLSNEFTDMITTQRGFQANSRIITVSDTMLEELTNLKR